MINKIGAITIGQSPRNDIIPDLKSLIGLERPIKVCGILDGLGDGGNQKISSCQ